MKDKAERLVLLFGVILLLAALILFAMNQWEARQAEQAVETVLPLIVQRMEEPATDTPAESTGTADTVEIDGYSYIGYLSIPALGLELPVMEEWDYSRLKIAPCRYSGSALTDDLVISAHNYPRHFGTLNQLSPGDEVVFAGVNGLTVCYQVAEVTVLPPTAIEEMTSGEYGLTLFTCTYGGKSRITVRCVLKEPDE